MSKSLAHLNAVIAAKRSALESFKASRKAFRKAIDALPAGHAARRMRGNSLSKDDFMDGLRYNLTNGKPYNLLKEGQWVGMKVTEHHLKEGPSVLRKLQKLRKNLASNRDTSIKINIKSYDTKHHPHFQRRKFIAEDSKGKFLGRLDADFDKSQVVDIVDTRVREPLRGKGVGQSLFDRLALFVQKAKRSIIRTNPNGGIIHPAQIQIRDRYKTKFLARGIGRYGEQTKLVTAEAAKKMITQHSNGQVVALTNVSKKNVRFVRINGRIRPIRIKQ